MPELAAKANGAPPSSVGSMPSNRWCMIGLPTKVALRMSAPAIPASSATSSISRSIASRTAAVISRSPPGFIMT
jgi:hypothetical protein